MHDPITTCNDVLDVLTKVSFGINQHWEDLARSLGVPHDEIVGLRQKSLLRNSKSILMDGINHVLKSRILTWQELIDVVKEIEPVTGDRLAGCFGNIRLHKYIFFHLNLATKSPMHIERDHCDKADDGLHIHYIARYIIFDNIIFLYRY